MNALSKNEPHGDEEVSPRFADAQQSRQAEKDRKVTPRICSDKQTPSPAARGTERVLAWIAARPHRMHSTAEVGQGVGIPEWLARRSLQALGRLELVIAVDEPVVGSCGQCWRVTRQGRAAAQRRGIRSAEEVASTG